MKMLNLESYIEYINQTSTACYNISFFLSILFLFHFMFCKSFAVLSSDGL